MAHMQQVYLVEKELHPGYVSSLTEPVYTVSLPDALAVFTGNMCARQTTFTELLQWALSPLLCIFPHPVSI
jgi:hypothetical protein